MTCSTLSFLATRPKSFESSSPNAAEHSENQGILERQYSNAVSRNGLATGLFRCILCQHSSKWPAAGLFGGMLAGWLEPQHCKRLASAALLLARRQALAQLHESLQEIKSSPDVSSLVPLGVIVLQVLELPINLLATRLLHAILQACQHMRCLLCHKPSMSSAASAPDLHVKCKTSAGRRRESNSKCQYHLQDQPPRLLLKLQVITGYSTRGNWQGFYRASRDVLWSHGS